MYLDYLATTPISPKALRVMTDAYSNDFGNPASNHYVGLSSKQVLEQAQKSIAEKIGAEPSEIIFTSGATESNNLAIKGLARLNVSKGKHLITTSIEHSCILAIYKYLEEQGYDVTYVTPCDDGRITVESIRQAIRPDTTLVSVMHVNNELGNVNPIREIGQLCFEKQIAFHTDAAQSVGKEPIDVLDDNIDALSASAHKFFGPKGIGFLYLRDARHLNLEPTIHGSGQQNNLRGGTIPVPLIVGMSVALQEFNFDSYGLTSLRKLFLNKLTERKVSYRINGKNTLPNVLSLTFEKQEDFSAYTSQPSISVSQGSACNSNNIEPSHVLTAIGLKTEEAFRTVRISFYNDDLLRSANIFG